MTLTEAAAITKKSVYYIGIPVAIVFVVWGLLGLIKTYEELPQKYISPDNMCGQLPQFELETIAQEVTGVQFSIETTSGAIPDLPKVVNVFQYDHPGQSLLALQEAQIFAEDLGFEPEKFNRVSTTEYEWVDPLKARRLVIETGNLNISLTTDYSSPGVTTSPESLPSEENAKTIAMSYLRAKNLLTEDYNSGSQRTYLIQITADGQMREAPSLSEADLIRVDFFREKDLITIDPSLAGTSEIGSQIGEELEGEKPTTIQEVGEKSKEVKRYKTSVLNDSPVFGNISVYVGGIPDESYRQYEIFELEYRNWIVPEFACGTYGLITPDEAVRKVQEGKATLVHLVEKDGDQIIPYESKSVTEMMIFKVDLSYLDMSIKQSYLQPVFVVSGEATLKDGRFCDFYYYVPAIDYDSIPENAGIIETDEPSNGNSR